MSEPYLNDTGTMFFNPDTQLWEPICAWVPERTVVTKEELDLTGQLHFDPVRQTWEPVKRTYTTIKGHSGNAITKQEPTFTPPKYNTPKQEPTFTPPKYNTPKVTTSVGTTTQADGAGKEADKETIHKELTFLEGDASVEPNSVTLNAKAGETVELAGIGKHLTGLYFITEVTTEMSTSGLTLKFNVLRNAFGKTLKPVTPKNATADTADTAVDKTSVFNVQDTVKFIEGAEAYYSGASEGVRIPDWVKKSNYTVTKVSEDNQRVLLKQINSWTYAKYLQKV